MTWPSLCERCDRMRVVVSGKGARYLLCKHAAVDPRWPKYPPQPVQRCSAFREIPAPEREASADAGEPRV